MNRAAAKSGVDLSGISATSKLHGVTSQNFAVTVFK